MIPERWSHSRLRPLLLLSVSLILRSGAASAPGPADLAIRARFKKFVATRDYFTVLRRVHVDKRLDLVVASAGYRDLRRSIAGSFHTAVSWTPTEELGIFLQSRTPPFAIDVLFFEAGEDEFDEVEVVSADASELVLSVRKSGEYANLRYVVDVAGKKIQGPTSCPSFWLEPVPGNPSRFEASSAQQQISIEPSGAGFRIATLGVPPKNRKELEPSSEQKALQAALPKTTLRQWRDANWDDVRSNPAFRPELEDNVGATQRIGNKLWFGRSFHDGEGVSGVGGFGFFDLDTRKIQEWKPAWIVQSSVHAMLVEDDRVWLSLVHNGEYGPFSHGLVEYEIATKKATRYRFEEPVNGLFRHGESIYVASDFLFVLTPGKPRREFFVDCGPDGTYKMSPVR